MAKTQPTTSHPPVIRVLVSSVLLLAAVYILIRNRRIVMESLRGVAHSNPAWFALALFLIVLTFFIAAAMYSVLALHHLRYRSTLLVALAAAFTNRLGPAGLGGMGLNGIYLYRHKHTGAEATAVASVNNLLGTTAHLMLLAVVSVWRPSTILSVFRQHHVDFNSNWLIAVLFIVCLVLFMRPVRKRIVSFLRNLAKSVRAIGVKRMCDALLISMFMTVTYTLILLAAARSVGVHLGMLELFIAFSIGMLVGTATPTPGGLVGAEAGLFAGLVGYNVSSENAGTMVLLFRFVTYWLPIVPGIVALAAARRRKLV